MRGYHSYRYYKADKPRAKYVRKPHHKKKSENPKKAWREHKQMLRDKAKHGHWMSESKNGTKGYKHWYKIHANRQHRSIERMAMSDERFDSLHTGVLKKTHDPWKIW